MNSLPPWPNQKSGTDWLLERHYGALIHEMGTGKTRTVIDAVRRLDRVLVVCPIAVGPAWQKQFGMFDDSRHVCVAVDGTSARRAKSLAGISSLGRFAAVVNYDAVWRGPIASQIDSIRWDAIVCDESHRIKSASSKASRWLAKLASRQPQAKRICMTGTPCPNNPLDWFGQARFLDQSLLGGSVTALRDRIAVMHPRHKHWIVDWKQDALDAMRARLDPHCHRVTADEVLTLPDAVHATIDVRLSDRTREFYNSLEADMIARLDEGGVVTAQNRLVVVGRLQLAASGYTRLDDGDSFVRIDGEPAKRSAFASFLEDFPAAEPLVVFCKFLADIDEAVAACEDAGRTVSELSGRRKQLADWQSGRTDCIVIQQQCGGAGIDCTRASFCVYYSLSHSLGDYEQSLARLRRPGQAKTCRYYHMVAGGTVDEAIYEALADKRDVVESVIGRLTKRTGVAA